MRFISFSFYVLTFSFILIANQSFAQVSGTIFHDINANGSQESTNPYEPALEAVAVTAFLADGTTQTTTSDASGAYSFSAGQIPSGTKVRIEFTSLPAYANQIKVGGTLVHFLTAPGTNVNLGVAFPNDYCESNPMMVTPSYVETGEPTFEVVTKWSYNNVGIDPGDKAAITNSGQAGSMWGMAYSRSTKKIFAASVLKRHIPVGAEGIDAIYMIDPNTGSPNATAWLELTDDLGIAVSSISANPQYIDNITRGVDLSPQNDPQAFVDVCKVGLGDIELSADEKTLYVVNLYDKKLYAIDVASKSLITSYAIPDPGCNNGSARPWAVGEYEGSIYVGVTCDGGDSGNPLDLTDNSGVNNLSSSVYRLEGSSFVQVLSFPLSFEREPPFNYEDGIKDVKNWKPWASVLPQTGTSNENIGYPTPLLTDIEFDDNGNMVLGFTDRTGFQIGYKNYGPTGTNLYTHYAGGDILKACRSSNSWVIENAASGCASANGLAINANDPDGYVMSWGVLGKPGEFFWGDFFHNDGNFDGSGLSYFPGHPEIAIGGLAIVPGKGEVMAIAYDPVTGASNFSTGGAIRLSTTTGERTSFGYQLYATSTNGVTQAKGVGLGDIEALCSAAPVEITHRVWLDSDTDGVQDPDENPIEAICYEIFADFNNDGTPDGSALGSQTSDSDGLVFFTAGNVADGDPTEAGLQAGPQVGKNYLLHVCNSNWSNGAGTGALSGLSVTLKDADPTVNGEARDNDAQIFNTIPQVKVTTELTGQRQYVLGSGFTTAPPPCAITVLSATPSTCDPNTNTYTLTIELSYSNAPSGDITINGQTFTPNGTGAEGFTLTNLTANGTQDIDVIASFVADPACSHTFSNYDAPQSCAVAPCPPSNNEICPGDTYQLDAGAGLTTIQWFKDNVAIPGANSQTYMVTEVGSYHFTANLSSTGCNAQGCCPAIFVAGNCTVPCPPKICLPVQVVRN